MGIGQALEPCYNILKNWKKIDKIGVFGTSMSNIYIKGGG
jgi:hypothetical protein